jgi:hypothetical protein
MSGFVIQKGISLGRKAFRAVAQYYETSEEYISLDMRWREESGLEVTGFASNLISITRLPGTDTDFLLGGALGSVYVVNSDQPQTEQIDAAKIYGLLRDYRSIDNYIFAVGMSRQVYRRNSNGTWLSIDQGVLQPPKTLLDISGFNSIDGISNEDIYAAGFNGEIWRYFQGHWQNLCSPTNKILNDILAVKPNLVFVCGQAGILMKGYGSEWQIIDHSDTSEDLISMSVFKHRLYVVSEENIYRLVDGGKLELVKTGLSKEYSLTNIDADGEAIWVFGANIFARSIDGINWEGVEV